MSPPGRTPCLAALLALTLLAQACGVPTWPATLHPIDGPVPERTSVDHFLKVHMASGEMYLLSSWTVPEEGAPLAGSGALYDVNRDLRETGRFEIQRADIALLETNDRETVSTFSFSGLVTFSALTAIVTASCIADPKSCFGSCPTFYTDQDPDRPLAEGFSSSFARVLEERDVDQIGVRTGPGPFQLVMRNEALETHAVRHARLLAVPVSEGESVVQTSAGALHTASEVRGPVACTAESGSCLPEVERRDDVEYTSVTDEDDLAVREEVVVDFGAASGSLGVVLAARNSLVTTYVFYQALAYAGRQAGDVLAALERGEPGVEERVLGMARELGGIEIFVSEDGGAWREVGSFGEAGPIAADRQSVPLGQVDTESLRVKLRMAKGSWRIDEVALATLGGVVEPVAIEPDSVTTDRPGDPRAARRLADPEQHLVTVPGDAYRLWFTVPEGGAHELLLDTRGYYYEWTREGWLPDESAARAALAMMRPREALRLMAPGFKEVEADMERKFWSSRFRGEER